MPNINGPSNIAILFLLLLITGFFLGFFSLIMFFVYGGLIQLLVAIEQTVINKNKKHL